MVIVTSQMGLSRNGAAKDQKCSFFVSLSHFKTQKFENILGYHSGSEKSWSEQQPFYDISEVSEYTRVCIKQICWQKIPFNTDIFTNTDRLSGFSEHSNEIYELFAGVGCYLNG